MVCQKVVFPLQHPATDASNPVRLATTTIRSIRYSGHDVLPAIRAAPRHATGVRSKYLHISIDRLHITILGSS